MNQEIYCKLKEIKPILKKKYVIEEFALFGSITKSTDGKNSNIDIAIIGSSKRDFFKNGSN